MEPIRLSAFPFDSQITGYSADGLPEYDRASNSEEFAGLLKGFFRDGVFDNGALQVLAGGGLTATVSAGGVMVQGRVKHLKNAQTVEFETAASLPRLDRVIVRLDLSNAVRDLVLDVLTGTPASTPSAPALTRNDTVWEICLATVRIAASATSVSQSAITDTRLDSSLCGLVAAVLNDFDTNTFYQQVQADLAEFKEEEQAEFDEWFENLQAILDENVAANLQNQIDERVAVSAQSFTANERAIARDNIGALSHEQQTLSAGQKAQASSNIAAVSYEAQSLTDAQKQQARENIGAGEPYSYTLPTATASVKGGVKLGGAFTAPNGVLTIDGAPVELVKFIANATYSKNATIKTLVPFDASAMYIGSLGNIPTAINPASPWLRFGGVGIPGSSYQHSSIDTAIINFGTDGSSSGTLSYLSKYQISDSGAVSNKNPTSVTVGPIWMLREIEQ